MRRAYRCCLELHFCHLSWRLRPAVSPLHSSERAVRVRVVVVGSAGTAALLAYVVALYNSRRRSGPLKNTRGARSGIATGSLRGTRAAPHQIHRSRFARVPELRLRPARPKPHVTHGVFSSLLSHFSPLSPSRARGAPSAVRSIAKSSPSRSQSILRAIPRLTAAESRACRRDK